MDIGQVFSEMDDTHISYLKMVFPIEDHTHAYKLVHKGSELVAPYHMTIIDGTPCKRLFDEETRHYTKVVLTKSNKEEYDNFLGEVGVRVTGCVYDPENKKDPQYFMMELYKVMVQYFREPILAASFKKQMGVRILITDHSVNLTKSKKGKSYLAPILFKQWEAEKIPDVVYERIKAGAERREIGIGEGW